MMGIPQKEDLARGGVEGLVVKEGDRKSMQKLMTKLWKKSIEYTILTWRTRGFLPTTLDQINSWYQKGGVTVDMVKDIFEHQFEQQRTKTTTQEAIYDHAGFNIGRGSRESGERKDNRKREVREGPQDMNEWIFF
jgi:hypothetical protein